MISPDNATNPLSDAFRPLHADDAPALLAFYNKLSPASIRTFRPLGDQTSLAVCQTIVRNQFSVQGTRFDLVAWQMNRIVGWAFLTGLDSDKPELGLGVADAFQRQGLGRALLDHLLDWARQHSIANVYLVVVTDNQRAIQLYQSRGFVAYTEKFDELDQLSYLHMMMSLQPKAAV